MELLKWARRALRLPIYCAMALSVLPAWAAPAGVRDGQMIDTVEAGDTLYTVAQTYLRSGYDWRDLGRLNGVHSPTRLPPGMALRIPLAWMDSEPTMATVLHVNGAVWLVLGANTRTALRPGMALVEGAQLSCAPDANATLGLIDDSTINLHAGTSLVLERLRRYRNTKIIDSVVRVSQGGVESNVDPAHHGVGRFDVDTPLAVTGVRGTQFRVGMTEGGADMTNEVLRGTVAVQGSDGPVLVPEGKGVVVSRGGQVGAPRPLLSPPDLAGVASAQTHLIARFAYPALSGAVSYRAYVARDRALTDVVQAQRFKQPVAKFDDLPDGDYFLAVSGIDDAGLEGRRQVVPFRLSARPVPPIAVWFGSDDVPPSELRWTHAPHASAYRFQLATSADFSKPLRDERIEATRVNIRSLPPGRYYWRVASLDAQGREGAFGGTQSLVLSLPPERSDVQWLTRPAPSVHFAWRADTTDAYRFELARDAAFSTPVIDRRTHAPDITLPALPAGTYHVRVTALDADGFSGEATMSQRIDLGGAGAAPARVRIREAP